MHRKKHFVKRYIQMSDHAVLDVPVERPILDWWFECREIDEWADSPLSMVFDAQRCNRIREEFLVLCDLTRDVYEWCDGALTAAPEIARSSFVVSEEDCLIQPRDVIKVRYGSMIRLNFVTDKDLAHFKLRWL